MLAAQRLAHPPLDNALTDKAAASADKAYRGPITPAP
jgi:hypothetical protein